MGKFFEKIAAGIGEGKKSSVRINTAVANRQKTIQQMPEGPAKQELIKKTQRQGAIIKQNLENKLQVNAFNRENNLDAVSKQTGQISTHKNTAKMVDNAAEAGNIKKSISAVSSINDKVHTTEQMGNISKLNVENAKKGFDARLKASGASSNIGAKIMGKLKGVGKAGLIGTGVAAAGVLGITALASKPKPIYS